jgi:hypothetical protein
VDVLVQLRSALDFGKTSRTKRRTTRFRSRAQVGSRQAMATAAFIGKQQFFSRCLSQRCRKWRKEKGGAVGRKELGFLWFLRGEEAGGKHPDVGEDHVAWTRFVRRMTTNRGGSLHTVLVLLISGQVHRLGQTKGGCRWLLRWAAELD